MHHRQDYDTHEKAATRPRGQLKSSQDPFFFKAQFGGSFLRLWHCGNCNQLIAPFIGWIEDLINSSQLLFSSGFWKEFLEYFVPFDTLNTIEFLLYSKEKA